MATTDLSRSATDFRKHFTGVRAQMGRVFTDDDHNDNERIHGEDERLSRVHIIGPAGSPDAGFEIQNPGAAANGLIDFDILPGTFYLGGNRLSLEQTEKFQTQSDWLDITAAEMPAPPVAGERFDLVYLECWQQPVSAVEDGELFEVALGGPDTSIRLRLMRRVRVSAGSTVGDCEQDWANLTAQWTAAHRGTLDDQNELVVDTKLKVGFAPGSTDDLCSPPVAGGYLGAENQAIRVQLTDASHFTWGFDNAAPLYRVKVGANNINQMRKITMITEPKDQAHWPASGQVVEILPWSALLANDEKLAEVSGFLATVDASYDSDSHEFTITASVPAGFGTNWWSVAHPASEQFFYLRVWNRGSDTMSPPAIPFTTGNPVTLGNTGLSVTFLNTANNDRHPDDYWIVAARPESPNRVVPWLLESGRGPHGFRRFYAPLGVIKWVAGNGTVIHDCRDKFPPLTRIRTCCTYTVGDGTHSFGNYLKIQDAIDALPEEGGEICLLPGVFNQSFNIIDRHDISVHGCGSHTVVKGADDETNSIVTIQDSQRIQIHDFAIEAPKVVGISLSSTAAAEANQQGLEAVDLDDLTITCRDQTAIWCSGGRFIRIRYNDIGAQQLAAPLSNASENGMSPLVFVRADDVLIELNRIAAVAERRLVLAAGGLHIGGGSERVAVRRNQILGGNNNGITLGSITFLPADGAGRQPINRARASFFFHFGWIIDENGCIHPDPDPQDPSDPDNPLTPVSDGDLLDIRILENDILDMGLNGISTLRYFKDGFGPIVVRELDVRENRIRHCLQLDLGDRPFGSGFQIGFGGISLVSTEEFTLRNNFIEQNGKSFIDPVCGVYVLLARGVTIEGNRIADNGPRVETDKQPTAGPRGGIVILFALKPLDQFGASGKQGLTREGFPAARIAANTVIAPLGRALWLGALGAVSIEGNEFTSRGVERGDSVVTTFGVTVTILDLGISYELAGFFFGYTTTSKYQPASYVSDAALANSAFIGGEVLFNDNQVLLAPLDVREDSVESSVLVLSADHALLDGNQSECRLGRRILLINTLVLGWSVHVADNRFEEALVSPGLSAFTFALMNCTANNLGTRCFLVIGLAPLTIRNPNRSLASLLNSKLCESFSAAVAQKLKGSGFDA